MDLIAAIEDLQGYEYRCPSGHITDAYRTVEGRAAPEKCATCGIYAEKTISRTSFAFGDIAGYTSPLDGKRIESRSAHRAHMKAHGVIEVGNERLPPKKPYEPKGVREDIYRAIEEAKR
jgi:hypothetical protein